MAAAAPVREDFRTEIQRALQVGAPTTGILIIFAHLFFIGADLGFPQADFGLLVRYRVAMALLYGILVGLCFTQWGRSYHNIRALSMVIIGLCAVSVSNLTTMTGGSVSPYWTMIILTYFGGTLLLRLSPLEAGVTYGIALLYHVVNMLFVAKDNPQSPEFYTNVFGLLLSLVVSLTGNWYIRLLMQREYRARQSLVEANEKLRHSISELQYKRQQEQLRYLQKRLDLANDLHDVVGAKLSQMVVIAENERIDDTRQLRSLAASVLEHVRNFAHILKGEERMATLKSQLMRLADSLRALGRYEVSLVLSEREIVLPDLVLLNIDRILSEWTANAIRHAHATAFVLGARQKKSKTTIWFYQNNSPFIWRGMAERGGLKSIAMRAQHIGARITVRGRNGGALFVLQLDTPRLAEAA